MQIWNYRPTNGELIGAGLADPNPLEEGEWLVPAYATSINPGEPQPGRVYLFRGGSWESEPDHRGETWWKVGAEFNTEPLTINFIGEPTGLTNVEPPAPPVPVVVVLVSPRQIRLALTRQDWRVGVENYIAAGDQDERDTWQFASRFARDGLVNTVLTSLGKTPEEIDALFEVAKKL